MNNKRYSVTTRHKITLNRLTCRKNNQSSTSEE